jgi:type IX secretion system PorP/SprF family membrane protein
MEVSNGKVLSLSNTNRNKKLIKHSNMKKTINILCICLMWASSQTLLGQSDPMFTQYMFNELYINPAYAGSREYLSATALVRQQWVGLDGAPSTQTLSAHKPIFGNRIGAGLTFVNEAIGVSKRTQINANGAYRLPMGKNTLSFGLQLGLASISENLASLGLASDNQFATNTGRRLAPNMGFGTYYVTPKWYVGLSIPRLMQNRLDGSNGEVQNRVYVADWHYFIAAGSLHAINADWKIKPALMMKAVQGAPLQVDVNALGIFRDRIWGGLGFRTGDALSLLLGMQINQQLRAGYSYDYTTTALGNFNSGSHELMLGYDFNFEKDKVVSPRYF